MIRPWCIAISLCVAGTIAKAQTLDREMACATTGLLSEKAMCAWEEYREDAVWVAQAISRALIMVDGFQGAMDPDNPSEARDLLVASQEAWEAYREATCKLEVHLYFGGEGTALVFADCLHRLTEARATDFRILLQEN